MAAASIAPAGRRPARGALLTVSLGRAESEEWFTDEVFRADAIRDFSKRARERGRRYIEVYDDMGRRLHTGEVAS